MAALPGVMEIMDFEYIPCGNCHIYDGKVNCQHGLFECIANTLENCVKNISGNNPVTYMPFMECLEHGGYPQGLDKKAGQCLAKLMPSVNFADVMTCTSGAEGAALLLQAAKDTPPHHAVPWFTLNGQTLVNNSADDVRVKVCELWTGAKPACCSNTTRV